MPRQFESPYGPVTVNSVAYRRNGVSGNSFYQILFQARDDAETFSPDDYESREEFEEKHPLRPHLAICCSEVDEDGEHTHKVRGQCYVVALDDLNDARRGSDWMADVASEVLEIHEKEWVAFDRVMIMRDNGLDDSELVSRLGELEFTVFDPFRFIEGRTWPKEAVDVVKAQIADSREK